MLKENHEKELIDLQTLNQSLQKKLETYSDYMINYKQLEQ